MSAFFTAAALRRSGAKGNARLALIVLADMADDDGIASAAYSKLAQRMNASLSTVAASIAELTETGEVEIQDAGKGRGFPTVYKITVVQRAIKSETGTDKASTIPKSDKAQVRAEEKSFPPKAESKMKAVAPVSEPKSDASVPPQVTVPKILDASGIKPDPAQPFYWIRAAHHKDAQELIEAAGSLDNLLSQLRAAEIETDGIRRLTALKAYVKGARS